MNPMRFLPLLIAVVFTGCEYHCIVNGESSKMEDVEDREQASAQCAKQAADQVTHEFFHRGPLRGRYQVLEILHEEGGGQKWDVYDGGIAYARSTLYCHVDHEERFKVAVLDMNRSYGDYIDECRRLAKERVRWKERRDYDDPKVYWEFRRYFWDMDHWQHEKDAWERNWR